MCGNGPSRRANEQRGGRGTAGFSTARLGPRQIKKPAELHQVSQFRFLRLRRRAGASLSREIVGSSVVCAGELQREKISGGIRSQIPLLRSERSLPDAGMVFFENALKGPHYYTRRLK